MKKSILSAVCLLAMCVSCQQPAKEEANTQLTKREVMEDYLNGKKHGEPCFRFEYGELHQ